MTSRHRALRTFLAGTIFAAIMTAAALPPFLAPSPAAAQTSTTPASPPLPTDVSITRDEADYVFAESLQFTLEAASDSPIVDVVLRYTVGGSGIRNRRIPAFTPGAQITAAHQEVVVRGQIPPASEIRWWWTLTTEDGSTADTAPESILYLDRQFEWQSLDAPDIRVWWYDAAPPFAEELQTRTRDALKRLSALIGSPPGRRIEIVAYQNQADLRPVLMDRGGTYETRLATLGARVAPDILVLDAGTQSEDLFEVLTHELSHVVLNLHFAEDYYDAPLWLDEGLAMYVEGPLAENEQADLDAAIAQDRLMSVRSLTSFPGDAELVPLAYAESRDIVAFLIDDGGEAKFRRFLDVIAAGEKTAEAGLAEVYGYDQLGLYQAYRRHHGLPPAATPAPEAIATAQRERRRRVEGSDDPPAGWPCGSAGMALVALGAAWFGRSAARRAERAAQGLPVDTPAVPT